MIKITHYQRQKDANFHSIERIFEDIRKKISSDISVNVAISRYPSKGFFRRIYNCLEARIRQSDINHITGDIHYLGCLLSKKRMLLTIHDCVMMTRLTGIRRYIYWFFWLWLPVKRARVVVAVSEATRDELVHYLRVRPSNIHVIHNAISDEFVFSPKIFNYSLPVILQVGTGQNKNIENLINAINGIKCRLIIIGILTDHQVMLLEEGRINYLALSNLSRMQIMKEYQQADLVVFTSTYEGFGMPIIEANAIGRPVVTSNRSPMTEVSGGAAVLVNPDDVISIRDGIEKILEDAEFRDQLIQLGLKNAQRFSISVVAKQYEKIYRELAKPYFS